MPRAATTLDIFNAVAEPKRRAVINLLAGKQLSVNTMVETLRWPQPQVSKHLSVLKQVGLVRVERAGRQQLYSLNARELKPLYDWSKTFEALWTDHLLSIKKAAEERMLGKKHT